MSDKFYFFWGGPFSQWYQNDFYVRSLFDNSYLLYSCAEQFMMAEKARLFNDNAALYKILMFNSPSEQKKIGRQVKNFDPIVWEKWSKKIVKHGNFMKFSQNSGLRHLLLTTAPLTLVEASPYDKIWGIGLSANDPRALDVKTWRGKNWLGFILTDLRDNI